MVANQQPVAVLCTDPSFAQKVKQEPFFRVESIFSHAVNLLDSQNQLWTIVTRSMDDAPRTARIDLGDFQGLNWLPQQRVLMYSAENREFGQPFLDWFSAVDRISEAPELALESSERLAQAAQAVRTLIQGHPLGGAPYPTDEATDIASQFARSIHDAAANLLAAVRLKTSAAIQTALQACVGLGPGSTPSLDDFLVGMMLVASHRSSAMHFLAEELKTFIEAHPEQSTAVSMATLQTAAAADFRTTLARAAAALAQDPGSDKASFWINAVLEIGQSSGSDILSGLLAGLEMEQELRGCLWLSQL